MADPVIWNLAYGQITGLLDLASYTGIAHRPSLNLRLKMQQRHIELQLGLANVIRASALQAGAVDAGMAQLEAIKAVKEYERVLSPGFENKVSDEVELEALWYLMHAPHLIAQSTPEVKVTA